jgi:hypothetical protein
MSSTPSDEQDAANETEVRIRRAPKYPAFMIVGGGIGAIITFILTSMFPADPKVGFGALFGYFALYGVTAGILVGALLALLFDRIGLSRARPATVVTELADEPEPAPVAEPVEAQPTPVAEPVEAPRTEDPDAR